MRRDLSQASSDWLETVINTAPSAILTADPTEGFPITFVSESVRDQTGYEPAEYLSDASFWIDRVHPEDRERVVEELESLSEGEPRLLEYRFRTSSDSYRWMLDRRTLVVGDGAAPYMVGTKMDFTPYREVIEELKHSHQIFQDMDQQLTDYVIWVFGPELDEVTYVSSGYEAIWGVGAETVLEDPDGWMDPILTEDRPAVEAAAAGMATGDFDVEYRIRRPDGSVRWIWDRGFPVRDPQGELVHVFGVAQDITARKESELELQRFFVVALELLCIADLDGRFVRVNPSWTEVLGWSREELLDRPFLEFVHPDDRDGTIEAMASLEEGQDVVGFENRYRTKAGGYRRLSWKSVPDAEHHQVYAAARDVTEEREAKAALRNLTAQLEAEVEERTRELRRKAADLQRALDERQAIEDDLRSSERRYRELFQGSPLPMIEFGAEGRITEANEAMIELLGHGSLPDLMRERTRHDLFADSEDGDRLLNLLTDHSSFSGEEARWLRSDGEEVWVRISALATAPDEAPVSRIRSFVLDISRERELQKQLIQAQKMKAVGTLAGGVAHDFNNLLTVILANVELLLQEPPEPSELNLQLEEIQRASVQAKGVTDQLLTFSRQGRDRRHERGGGGERSHARSPRSRRCRAPARPRFGSSTGTDQPNPVGAGDREPGGERTGRHQRSRGDQRQNRAGGSR